MRLPSLYARSAWRPAGAGLLLLLCSCGILPDPDLERMKDQPNLRPFEESKFFADGRAMQAPPEFTVPHAQKEEIPKLDRALVDRGRERFNIYCAACHGQRGDGQSEVARNMDLRKPPSLVDLRIRQFPDECFERVMREGYGLMPSYSFALDTRDRWAVVYYLRALQLSQSVEIDRLPKEMQEAVP